jgi:Tfp pilus assembly protein PilP
MLIGRNKGFVVEIQKDRIIVEESLEGEEGEAIARWEVLRLPAGQD